MARKSDFENEEHNEDDIWNSEEENEGEDRINFYRRICHGDDDDYDEEQLNSWANERFKRKSGGKAVAVYLPSLSSTVQSTNEKVDEKKPEEEPKLNLPKGGWQVQRVEVSGENTNLPTLMSSMVELKPKKKFSGPRENAWKKMPNFFSDAVEATSLPISEPSSFGRKAPPQVEARNDESEYQPVISRSEKSRERLERQQERKPRLLPVPTKKDDKPQFLKNTKMCKNGENCSRRGACTFAHTISEFNPITCRFQDKCNQKDTCSFKHNSESKEDYLQRLLSMS